MSNPTAPRRQSLSKASSVTCLHRCGTCRRVRLARGRDQAEDGDGDQADAQSGDEGGLHGEDRVGCGGAEGAAHLSEHVQHIAIRSGACCGRVAVTTNPPIGAATARTTIVYGARPDRADYELL